LVLSSLRHSRSLFRTQPLTLYLSFSKSVCQTLAHLSPTLSFWQFFNSSVKLSFVVFVYSPFLFSSVICLTLIFPQAFTLYQFSCSAFHSPSFFQSASQNSLSFSSFNSLIFSPCLSNSLSINLSNSHRSYLTHPLFRASIHSSSSKFLYSLTLSVLLAANLSVKRLQVPSLSEALCPIALSPINNHNFEKRQIHIPLQSHLQNPIFWHTPCDRGHLNTSVFICYTNIFITNYEKPVLVEFIFPFSV